MCPIPTNKYSHSRLYGILQFILAAPLCPQAAIAAGALAAHAPRIRAALAVTDQQNTVYSHNFTFDPYTITADYFGQSFTPSLAVMNAVTVALAANQATETLRLDVLAGVGLTGTVLASSAPVTFGNTIIQSIEFDLANPLALVPGNMYTLALAQTYGQASTNGFQTLVGIGNPYAGGGFYAYGGGYPYPDYDIVFAEGVTSASLVPSVVPEPSTWATLFVGAGVLCTCALRRRRSDRHLFPRLY